MDIEEQLPSPLQSVSHGLLKQKNIHLFIKRDDLIHDKVSGNKYRKLKYNLTKLKSEGILQVISFGGAFSNHIHALAAACQYTQIQAIGIIRGELDLNNPTLKYCTEAGMILIPVTRGAYRLKEKSLEVQRVIDLYPGAAVIPEGGTNELALYGVGEILDEIIMEPIPTPDYFVLAGGTGGTTAGLLNSDNLASKVICFSALKSDHLQHEILRLAHNRNEHLLIVNHDYHFGGYAKWNAELCAFIDQFETETNIPLDHVYNGKAMYGLMDLIEKNYFTEGSNIVYIHTGGLQGKNGLTYMQQKLE